MRIAGVVAEFNPFHNGHAALCAAARAEGATHIVAVMSGNYVQRAEFAIAEKRVRAACAIDCGADLVLELPVAWATATARTFAAGGVGLLSACGCVDTLCFGSESGDADTLRALAAAVEGPGVGEKLRAHMLKGVTFAKARELAVRELYGDDIGGHLSSPNDLLAVEYLRQAGELGWAPKILAVKRKGVSHDAAAPSEAFASASYLRARAGNMRDIVRYLPHDSAKRLAEAGRRGLFPADKKKVELAIMARLRTFRLDELENLPDLSEGIENRLFAAIHTACSISEVEQALKSKRYTLARVRRLILSTFLGITKQHTAGYPPYIRVLGMGPLGREILSKMRESAVLPVDTSLARLSRLGGYCKMTAELESLTTDLYTLALPRALPCGYDMTAKAVIEIPPDAQKKNATEKKAPI